MYESLDINQILDYEDLDSQDCYVCFDFETTGIKDANAIVEIAAIKFQNGEILETFSSLVNPRRTIPADAQAVHGINEGMVKDAPMLEEVLPPFLFFLEEHLWVGHYLNFDIRFLNNSLKHFGFTELSNGYIDTVTLAKKSFPKEKDYKLGTLAESLGIDKGQAHRALDDTKTCMQVFYRCLEVLQKEKDL